MFNTIFIRFKEHLVVKIDINNLICAVRTHNIYTTNNKFINLMIPLPYMFKYIYAAN